MLNSSYQWAFLLVLVVMTMAATLVVVVPLLLRQSGASTAIDARRLALPALGAIAIAAAAGAIYLRTGAPQLVSAPAPIPHPGLSSSDTSATAETVAGSMEDATSRLAERLRRNPDDIDGWRLLAQSYEVMGRADAASEAWRHVPGGRAASAAPTMPTAAPATPMRQSALPSSDEIEALVRLTNSRPQDSDAWLTLAQAYRLARRFPEANAAYGRAAKIGHLSADDWADYADAQAAGNGGRLAGGPETAIDRALTQAPDHTKALWLKGSAEVERRNFRAALKTWERLASRMPQNSPDRRAIEGNIAEARAALGTAAGAAAAPQTVATRIVGTVVVAAALRQRLRPDDTLFVVAKSAAGGPPYAVLRSRAGALPLSFQLDDSLAMVPGHSLSTASSVIVEARVSRSGDAMPRSGDLRATSAPVDVAGAPRVELTLAEVVP